MQIISILVSPLHLNLNIIYAKFLKYILYIFITQEQAISEHALKTIKGNELSYF